jgi:hypothetical protein
MQAKQAMPPRVPPASNSKRPPRAKPARRGSFGRIKEKTVQWLHGEGPFQKRTTSGSKAPRRVVRARKVQLMQLFSKKASKSVLWLHGDLATASDEIALDSPRTKRKRAEELAAACHSNPEIPPMPVPRSAPLADSPSALKLRKTSGAESELEEDVSSVIAELEAELASITDGDSDSHGEWDSAAPTELEVDESGQLDDQDASQESSDEDPSRLSPSNDVVVLDLGDGDDAEVTLRDTEENVEEELEESAREQHGDGLRIRVGSFECKDSHVVFNVEVTTASNTSWELQKRYSEFLSFYDGVKDGLGAPPIPFPPKLWSSQPSEEQLEERKVQLQDFISEALSRPLSSETWSELQAFFEIPENSVEGEFVLV